MPKQIVEFSRYDASVPADIEVWCAPEFREEVGAMFHAHKPKCDAHIANFNVLAKRLATGVPLSSDSFPPEPPGHAFKCGPLRFYGVFSTKSSKHFALSHVIYKKTQKLADADKTRMAKVLSAFDAFLAHTQRVKS